MTAGACTRRWRGAHPLRLADMALSSARPLRGWQDAFRLIIILWLEGTCLTNGEESFRARRSGFARPGDSGEVIAAAACFNSTETLQLSCGSGQMIRITRSFFGRSRTGKCGYTQGDCILKDPKYNDCAGRRNCTINLPSGNLGRTMPQCEQRSTFIQVEYICVPAEKSVDICEQDEVTTQTGYIHSPRYPLNYPAKQKCRITITVYPQQTLRVYVIDLQLNPQTNTCTDSLYLQDRLHSHTICGGSRRNEDLFRSLENQITVTFHSNGSRPEKGFWLYYEAIPFITTTTTTEKPTTRSVSTTQPSIDRTRTSAPPSRPTLLSVHTSSSSTSQILQDSGVRRKQQRDLSIEAIVGGVLGSLLVVLLVLVLLLLCKRRRENKFLQSTSSQQLNPQVVTPTTTTSVVSYPWDASKFYDIEETC